MATCDDSEDWEDFEVPELVIPVESPVQTVLYPLAKEKHVSKILTETEIREMKHCEKEQEIAFAKAKQSYIDYRLKTEHTTYNRMNAIGKKKTMAKIMNEIKDCKNAGSILTRLQIQKIVDTGGILGGMEFG